jgi:hypothetical protein
MIVYQKGPVLFAEFVEKLTTTQQQKPDADTKKQSPANSASG